MDEHENIELEESREDYTPRPWWQIWGARVLLVIFIVMIALYYLRIARG